MFATYLPAFYVPKDHSFLHQDPSAIGPVQDAILTFIIGLLVGIILGYLMRRPVQLADDIPVAKPIKKKKKKEDHEDWEPWMENNPDPDWWKKGKKRDE